MPQPTLSPRTILPPIPRRLWWNLVLFILLLSLTVGLFSDFGTGLVNAREISGGVGEEVAQQLGRNEEEATRAAARRLSTEAEQLRSQGTVELLRQAAVKYEAALLLWHEVGDLSEEAFTLYYLGGVYKQLGDIGKALNCYREALPLFESMGERAGVEITRLQICRLQNPSHPVPYLECERS
ncbi:MAG TPA: hypothetical protein DDZ80_11625 [Cyanobacteria bacterium UBA8803]|nr:hypothetical protein [Cyanobacteria bacterium UBA9273]HBL59134.1 hypothetical protein [Cyanobacteria bacterium UBA8803]